MESYIIKLILKVVLSTLLSYCIIYPSNVLLAQTDTTKTLEIQYSDNRYDAVKANDHLLTLRILTKAEKKPISNLRIDIICSDSIINSRTTNEIGEITVNLNDIINIIDNYNLIFKPSCKANSCTVNIPKSLIENNCMNFDRIKESEKTAYKRKKDEDKIQYFKTKYPKWSSKAIQAVIDEKVYIGMTKEQALVSWGPPEEINTTTTKYGSREQWVYSLKCYLYFEGNKLVAIQN